jgi:adenylate cyclase
MKASFWRATAANLLAGALVLPYFEATGKPPTHRPNIWWYDPFLFASYALVLGCVARWFARREARLIADAPARRVLEVPQRAAVFNMVNWIVIAVVSTAANYSSHHETPTALRVFFGLLVAGLAASFLTALVVERTCRPLFAHVLAGRPPERRGVLGIRRRLVLFWALGSGIPLVGVLVTPIGLGSKDTQKVIAGMAVVAAIGLVSGLVFAFVAARSVAEPLADVRLAMDRVSLGELDADVPVDDDGEIGLLQAGFNHMAGGLREREQLRELFGGYVGEEVARQALDAGVSLEGEEREVSVLFVDVVGSTALAEQRSAVEVVQLLNQFFVTVIGAVDAEGGWVNKFEGDAALCVFGVPVEQADHAARALRAAVAMRDALRSVRGLDAGIGVSSGVAVAGNVGSQRRYEYTVVGDPVNEAARLTDLAKSHPGRIVVSERTVDAAGASADGWRRSECLTLRGRTQPTQTFVPV